MKILFTFLILIPLIIADDDWKPKTVEEIRKIRADCLKENFPNNEGIGVIKNLEYPDTEPVRKYLLCVSEQMGIFCDEKGFHANRIVKQFKVQMNEAESLAITEGCIDKNEQNSPKDVWIYRVHKCLMDSKIGDKMKEYIRNKKKHHHHAKQH